MADKGLSASKFAEFLEIQPSGISHILAGRNKPGMDFIVKCLNTFPDLNPEWFVLGNGPMYRTTQVDSPDSSIARTDSQSANNDHAKEEEENLTPPEESSSYSERISNSTLTDPQTPVTTENSNQSTSQNTSKASALPSERRICRVMIFYEDHTVESFDYSENR